MRHILLTALAAILLASPAAAQDATPPQEATTAMAGTEVDGEAPVAPPDPMVCRRVDIPGSRLSTEKICKPRSEWGAQGRRRSGGGSVQQTDCGGPSGCEIYALPST
jgi:hypothetical protein